MPKEPPDCEIIEKSYRTYKYSVSRISDKVERCSVCGNSVEFVYRQIQYHKSKETGCWIFDFAVYGHKYCLKESRR